MLPQLVLQVQPPLLMLCPVSPLSSPDNHSESGQLTSLWRWPPRLQRVPEKREGSAAAKRVLRSVERRRRLTPALLLKGAGRRRH